MQLTNQIIIYLDEEHDGESEWLFPSPRDNTNIWQAINIQNPAKELS